MANADKNLANLEPHLEAGESVLAYVQGTYETKVMGSDTVRKGILAATDRRVLFFAKKLGGYDLESFPYGNISSMEQGKSMMGGTLTFFSSGNKVHVKWIDVKKSNLGEFMTLVHAHMNEARSSGGATAPAAAQVDVVDQLRKLGELRDAGILTDEEFNRKKADLLERM